MAIEVVRLPVDVIPVELVPLHLDLVINLIRTLLFPIHLNILKFPLKIINYLHHNTRNL